jgi:AsmA protein
VTRMVRVVGAALVLAAAAAVVVPLLLPVDSWKPAIRTLVKEATGRDLRLDGEMRLALLPRLELSVADVGLSNAPGASAPEMITLERLHVVLKVWPLLSGKVLVDRLAFDRPVVQLEIAPDGNPNWDFTGTGGTPTTKESPAPANGPQPQPATPANAELRAASAGGLHLDEVRLTQGTVRFVDRRDGTAFEIPGIDGELTLPGFGGPFRVQAEFSWKGRPLVVEATATDPGALLDQGSSAVTLRADAAGSRLHYEGSLAAGAALRLAGDLAVDVPSLRDLLSWLEAGVDAPPGTLGALGLRGRVEASRESLSLSGATVSFDGLAAAGRVAVSLSGPRPRIDAVLDLPRLDLVSWLPVAAPPPEKGLRLRDGWSDEPVSADALRAVDAVLALSVGELVTPRVRAGKGRLLARLEAGKLVLDLGELALHGGSGRGTLTVQAAREGETAVACDLRLADVSLEPLLRDASGGGAMTGQATFEVRLGGRGRSVRDILGSLDGDGSLDIREGSIRGINLAAMVLNVATAFQKSNAGDRTEFERLRGSFRVREGVLHNPDLELRSPLLEAEGQGRADIGRRTLDYRISPRFVAPVAGQLTGGAIGMKVPVLVRGRWDDLRYSPDLAGLLRQGAKAPGSVLQGAKDFTRGLFGR